jgi:hypothetical protein
VVASTTTAPTLLVVRKASRAGTRSKAASMVRPSGEGSSGGKSPTITGRPTTSRPTTRSRSRARLRHSATPTAIGMRNEASTTNGEVR